VSSLDLGDEPRGRLVVGLARERERAPMDPDEADSPRELRTTCDCTVPLLSIGHGK
jgi:hypothetical protein